MTSRGYRPHSRMQAALFFAYASETEDATASQAEEAINSRANSNSSSEDSVGEDDGMEDLSEISVESPELPKHSMKGNKAQQQKRKRKSAQKPPQKK